MFKGITEIKNQLWSLDSATKRNILLLGFAAFSILFSYPLIRSSATAVFLQNYGAKNSPAVWVWSVLALSILVSLYNHYQLKFRIHNLYAATGIFSIAFILICMAMIDFGHGVYAWPLYVWKEVYIVVMLHMVYGLLNTLVDIKIARILYGPLGALGSLGGIFGGLLASELASHMQVSGITIVGCLIIIMSIFSYLLSDRVELKTGKADKATQSPLASVKGVGSYVSMMAVVVILTQFVINLANFKFNILFEIAVPDQVEKTAQLGRLYTWINSLAFALQVIVLPFLLRFVSLRKIHIFIPIVYVLAQFWSIGGGALAVASMFMILKGTDYSIFAVCKELLYFPLSDKQKYGAKYIVDMFCYRFGKGLISFIMIYVQTLIWIDVMLYAALGLWLCLVFPLLKKHKELQG
ncbi:MAG: hypothetical protein CME71_00900 [Halobacteriovorax sp.]|nr:hypothetical protein [Halobacteriovorax sp.]